MEKIPNTISFRKENYQKHIDNWNKENNNNLTKWLKDGLLIEIEKYLFMNKDILQEQKKELENWYKLIDLNIINLNNLQDEIKFYCGYKANKVKGILNDYFDNSDNHNIKLPFNSLCIKIIEQPLYLLEAIEKHPEDLPEQQKIYYRYKYLNSKLGFAKDKFLEFKKGLNYIIRKEISNEKKGIIKSIFLFIEQFIDELKYNNHTTFNYFQSPLFKTLFSEIIKFKGYYLETFGQFNFAEILEVEKRLIPISIKGFNCQLLPETIISIHSQMVDKKYIQADLKDFQAIFSIGTVNLNKPVIWCIKHSKKKPNKTALFTFLKMMLNLEKVSRDVLRKANKLFEPTNIFPDRYTYPSPNEQQSSVVHYFKPIKQIIINTRPQ